MESTVKERLIKFIKAKGLTNKAFEQAAGLSNGYVNNILSEPRRGVLEKILLSFPDLNKVWLLTGEGDMIRHDESEHDGIPFYSELPASAGQTELYQADEVPSGYINVPGVFGKYAFPVIGCSMEPVVHAGDIVVVDDVNSWERLDPDKIYLVITANDRMIKHLEADDTNDEILWCISPNYKRFYVMKAEIRKIFKVTFAGRVV